jgi:hypothetical protein
MPTAWTWITWTDSAGDTYTDQVKAEDADEFIAGIAECHGQLVKIEREDQ